MTRPLPAYRPLWPLRPMVQLGFGVKIATILALGVMASVNWYSAKLDAEWVTHTYDVLNQVAELVAATADDAVGARDFVLSQDPEQLAIHQRGRRATAEGLGRLRQMVADNQGQLAEIATLAELLRTRSAILEGLIAQLPAQQAEAAQSPRWLDMVHASDGIRASLERLQASEHRLLERRRQRLADRALLLLLIIGGGCGLLLALVLTTLAAALRLERQRERVVSYQGELMGIVGHDLRSPLSAITTSVSLLQTERELPRDKRIQLSRRALASAHRMERMIRDLLDFTTDRVGGGVAIEPRDVELAEICDRVVRELRLEYGGASITQARDGDLRGTWDPDRIGQITANLLSNALKYGAEGQPVELIARGEADQVVLEVHNRGEPIPADLLPNLFEPFQRGRAAAIHGSGRRRVGLGLHIVAALAQAHGGAVVVESGEAQGTTFRVTLPRRPKG